jgi:hypothetical protein
MASTKVIEQPRPMAIVMSYKDLLRVIASGLVIGLITYALYVALDRYVFTPALCGNVSDLAGRCQDKETFASSLAMVGGAIVGLFAMVQAKVYRPLLVVLFATISLWGVPMLLVDLPWWVFTAALSFIFALAYAAFAWIVQVRNLYVAVGAGIVFLVVLRLLINT